LANSLASRPHFKPCFRCGFSGKAIIPRPKSRCALGTPWFRRPSGPARPDVKEQFGASVDFVADNRLVFDIGGDKYRLIVHAAYRYKRVLVKFVGTHAEYDKIDPVTCEVK
jgi:mRNA interferase HigB